MGSTSKKKYWLLEDILREVRLNEMLYPDDDQILIISKNIYGEIIDDTWIEQPTDEITPPDTGTPSDGDENPDDEEEPQSGEDESVEDDEDDFNKVKLPTPVVPVPSPRLPLLPPIIIRDPNDNQETIQDKIDRITGNLSGNDTSIIYIDPVGKFTSIRIDTFELINNGLGGRLTLGNDWEKPGGVFIP